MSKFEIINTIDNVIQTSSGNTYSILVKSDGTVWASGDYAHGDDEIKSKTKGAIWTQVGNDETGLEETEIVIKVGESKNIASNCSYEFNLIYLDENFTENLNFESLKPYIATIDNSGQVQGIRIGKTRVNAISSTTNKIYSVLVKVIKEDSKFAPKVSAGENFAAVLKADGSIWTIGYKSGNKKFSSMVSACFLTSSYLSACPHFHV